MKKFLSLVFVFVMLLTVVPFVYAEYDTTYKVGDIIQFGSYPQTEVKDETLLVELNSLAPAWSNWTSYKYYKGNGSYGSMEEGDWMRYTDVVYGNEKYRGVRFSYRPYSTRNHGLNKSNTYQDDNGYYETHTYWFKFEDLNWRILDLDTGLVVCENIIDSQPFSNTIFYDKSVSDFKYSYFNDSEYSNYSNDYETSSIREWLNTTFYDTAFLNQEKEEIKTSILNNKNYNSLIGKNGYEEFDGNDTSDKIFLLSWSEVINVNFGFNDDRNTADITKRAFGSDYAKCQGLDVYNDLESEYNAGLIPISVR